MSANTSSLISVSELTCILEEDSGCSTANAKPCSAQFGQGYYLHVTVGYERYVVSTYLSDNPKLYKRPDALLREVKRMGLKSVIFDI